MPQSLYDLEGEHLLSGVEVLSSEGYGYGVVFTLDGVSYEVLEDPDDGYRSHCGELTVAEQPPKFSFPPQPVLCAMRPNDPMVEQHDDILDFYNPETNQRILSPGTANYDDWYPYFDLEYHPEHLPCNQCKEVSEAELRSILSKEGFLC